MGLYKALTQTLEGFESELCRIHVQETYSSSLNLMCGKCSNKGSIKVTVNIDLNPNVLLDLYLIYSKYNVQF